MGKYIKYLNYVLKHKWYVMIECFKQGRYWRGIMHDMSKFRPDEFIPYARYFYGGKRLNPDWTDGFTGFKTDTPKYIYKGYPSIKEFNGDVRNRYLSSGCYKEKIEEDFDIAWLKHIHRNPHHWQHWLLNEDSGKLKRIEMTGNYIDEMIADWNGAGMAITGKNNTREWYIKNRDIIDLNPKTEHIVETCLNVVGIN